MVCLLVCFYRRINLGTDELTVNIVLVVCKFGWRGKLRKGISGQVKKYLGRAGNDKFGWET